jgi:hypothetical protein
MHHSFQNHVLTIHTQTYRIAFGTKDFLSLQSIRDETGMEWAGDFRIRHSLWEISFLGPAGASPTYTSNQSIFLGEKILSSTSLRMEIQFSWHVPLTIKGACRVEMRVRCEESNPLSSWSIKVLVPKHWNLARVDFPILPHLIVSGQTRAVVPTGWGLEHVLKPGFRYEGRYPSWSAAMQMVSLCRDDRGLYIGAHDVQANLKHFIIESEGESACFRIINWCAISPADDGEWSLPYETAIGFFKGGYYEAGQIYRQFSLQTPWGQLEKSFMRRIPQWLKDTDLWLRPDGAPEENLEMTNTALKYFDVPIALHWYRWHKIPYDTLYPEYFPPLPRFIEAIREWQAIGAHVMVYINGRLWDPDSESWEKQNAARAAVQKQNGLCKTEVYGSRIPHNVMCPFTELWQTTVRDIVKRLTGEYGLDGVYIDQIGAAAGLPCHNPEHGHPPGGGAYWHEGYRKLLMETRKCLDEGQILTTEENAECWLDLFDALLMVNTPLEGTMIPLFPAVYSDRTILFGSLYYAGDEPQNSIPFRIKNARAFVWGAQLGWIQPARIMSGDARKEAEFLRTLARTRRHAHHLLIGGRFLGMLDIKTPAPRLAYRTTKLTGDEYLSEEECVSGSLWLSDKGELGIILVNISNEEQKIKFSIPFEKACPLTPHEYTLHEFGPSGFRSSQKSYSQDQEIRIPGAYALVLLVR